jgi:hypothetical protein
MYLLFGSLLSILMVGTLWNHNISYMCLYLYFIPQSVKVQIWLSMLRHQQLGLVRSVRVKPLPKAVIESASVGVILFPFEEFYCQDGARSQPA